MSSVDEDFQPTEQLSDVAEEYDSNVTSDDDDDDDDKSNKEKSREKPKHKPKKVKKSRDTVGFDIFRFMV